MGSCASSGNANDAAPNVRSGRPAEEGHGVPPAQDRQRRPPDSTEATTGVSETDSQGIIDLVAVGSASSDPQRGLTEVLAFQDFRPSGNADRVVEIQRLRRKRRQRINGWIDSSEKPDPVEIQ